MTFLGPFFKSSQSKIKAINERLDTLESEIRRLRLEWLETYDKTTHAIERWSKREKTSKPTEEKSEVKTDAFVPGRLYTDEELMEIARKRGVVG